MKPTFALLVLVAAPAVRAAQEDPAELRAFTYPLTRFAREQAALVVEHTQAERWKKVVEVLQEMILDHENAVLPDPYRRSASKVSVHLAHPGAGEWARARLRELPREACKLYRERYAATAQAALNEARRQHDRRALVSVADRWPLTDAAIHAWWVLGDLEMEAGHTRAALDAWDRARDVLALLELPAPEGDASRESFARAVFPGSRTESEADRRGPLPSREAAPWTTELDLEPFDRSSRPQYFHNLLPTALEERVFVSSTLEVFALDAYGGELLWRSGQPRGWENLGAIDSAQLYEGLNRQELLIAPAAAGRVVVAALQLPFSEFGNEHFQGIEIMASIPERRLFAFDAETGAPLWDHAPPMTWNQDGRRFEPGETHTFAERMKVAGPPVVAGSRVIVPSYDLEGRIDYHVACYDLETGVQEWTAGIVSGQRSRNMFGRAMREFCATPAVVAGDRVVVQTELGTVAALDLVSGRILWESLYYQVPLPRSPGYTQTERATTWRLSPPVIVDDVVLSTPADSDELTAFDLRDGRVLWTQSQSGLSQLARANRLDLLLGADAEAVYLGGESIARLESQAGLRSHLFRLGWSFPVDSPMTSSDPRPVLCDEQVLVPLLRQRIALDRREGRVQRSLSADWAAEYGRPLVVGGQMFTLSQQSVSGFFDWELLLERQERLLAASPDDPEVALETATLYSRRASAAVEAHELFAALDFSKRGRRLLEPLVDPADGSDRLVPRASQELHTLLLTEAAVHELDGHRAGALQALALARPLARSREALRDTLLQEERNLRDSNRREEHLEVLRQLEERVGDLPLTVQAAQHSVVPIDVRSEAGTEADERVRRITTVGLWVLLTRGTTHERFGELGPALADWHQVIARYPDVGLSPAWRAGELAEKHIARALELPAGRVAYEPFERAAAALYASALEEGSLNGLEAVGRLYPHSRAALDADEARLEHAYEASNAGYLARVVYDERQAARRRDDSGALVRLARVLGRLGNTAFERGVLRMLAGENPGSTSDLSEHGGRTLSELAQEAANRLSPRTTRLPRFDHTVIPGDVLFGSYEYVGAMLAPDEQESAAEELHFYLHRQLNRSPGRRTYSDIVNVYSSTDMARPARQVRLDDPVQSLDACALAHDRLVLGGRRVLQAFDGSANLVWRRELDAEIDTVAASEGVVLVMTEGPWRVTAFDVHNGVQLWSRGLEERTGWRRPLFAPGRVVMCSSIFPQDSIARVLDLYRGTLVSQFDLGATETEISDTAWTAGSRLVVPYFQSTGRARPHVTAFDIETGASVWNAIVPEPEEFEYVVRYDDEVYLVTTVDQLGANGGIYSVDHEFGSLRRVVQLRATEMPIGLDKRRRNDLDSPDLFTYTEAGTSQIVIRALALHLPFQARWTRTMRVNDLDTGVLPRPAVSEDTVALIYVEGAQHRGGQPYLTFIERDSGLGLDTMMLDEGFGRAFGLELRGLGDALFVVGGVNRTSSQRMQILEKIR